MKAIKYIWIGTLAVILSSCGKGFKSITTSSTGRNGEILVVTERDLWRGDLKDTIYNFFTEFQYGLPQTEPRFTVFQTPLDEFSRILRPHRSILMITIDKSLTEAKITVAKDKWAVPQVLIKLMGPTREALVEKFWQQRENIADFFIESEYRRYQKVAENMGEKGVQTKLQERYGYSLEFPQGYAISSSTDNFCWIRKETKEFSHGVLFYTFNYTDAKMLEQESILYIRDTITKSHIPGPSDSSYMAVSYQVYKPQSKEVQFNGKYCIETRGLWRVENDFMGGPFVNYTFVDKARNLVVVLDGYVYAPRDNKRDMLRSIEAVLHTWKPVAKKAAKK